MSEVNVVFEHDALTELAREALEDSEESAHAYLAQSWLSAAIEKLYDARREAELTQREVAERLGTKQPAIARLEKDDEGRVSLHRYVEYALACGVLPLDISLRPAAALREYALKDPEAPRTEESFDCWWDKTFISGNVATTIRTILPEYQKGFVRTCPRLVTLFESYEGWTGKAEFSFRSAPTTSVKQSEGTVGIDPKGGLGTVEGVVEAAA